MDGEGHAMMPGVATLPCLLAGVTLPLLLQIEVSVNSHPMQERAQRLSVALRGFLGTSHSLLAVSLMPNSYFFCMFSRFHPAHSDHCRHGSPSGPLISTGPRIKAFGELTSLWIESKGKE